MNNQTKQNSFTEVFNGITSSRNEQASALAVQLGCDQVLWVLTNPLYFARQDNKWGIVDATGQWLVPCVMDGFFNCPDQIQEVVPLQQDNKWGFYTLDGLFVEPQFDDFTDDGDDIVSVRLGDTWGWLDEEGHFVTPEDADARDIMPLSWWCQELHPRYQD